MSNKTVSLSAALALVGALSGDARGQVAEGLIDPNTAAEQELLALPHMSPAIVKGLIERRPLASALELDAFLAESGLDAEQRAAVYGGAFIHVNLDTASAEEIVLIPGAGRRMAHEFEEYRPWKSWAKFEREIGKYVDEKEVARLQRYCFIPMDLNTASEADFLTIPGVGQRMAHEFEEYRPWKSQAQFEREIGKYVDEKEVTRLWRYFVVR